MDNPIDHPIDLGLVNYVRHPENTNYVVFRFSDILRAESFEEELVKAKIWFEKGEEDRKGKVYTLFGVHKNDYKKAEKINFMVEAKHKKPFIPFKIFRFSVILISTIAMTLAVLGYCATQNKLRSINENDTSINRAH